MPKNATNRAFTLIELLVVIAVIALLVGMLFPAFNQARIAAKRTSTRAFISTLEGGLDAFRAQDDLSGGKYPPSVWDTSVATKGNPYKAANTTNPLLTTNFTADGAQVLVWALLGADMKGSPGFRDKLDTLYELNNDTAKTPLHRRAAAFVDVPSENIKPCSATGIGKFENPQAQSAVPVFADMFGGPILYYACNKNGQQGSATPFYNYDDNKDITAVAEQTKISKQADLDPFVKDASASALAGGGNNYVPYNAGRFILISPGPDKIFGTTDDITNFRNEEGAMNKRHSNLSRRVAANTQAFTLVELMVVIFIIAIVIALIVGVARYVRDESSRKQTEATQTIVMSAIDAFYGTFEKYPCDNQDTTPRVPLTVPEPGQTPQAPEKSGQTLLIYLAGGDAAHQMATTPKGDFDYLGISMTQDAYKAKVQAMTKDKLLQLPRDAYDPTADPWSIRDGYGQPMRYMTKGGLGGRPVLISAGSDEKFNTDDDIRSDGR